MCDRTVRSPKSPIFIQKWPTCTWNEPNMCDRTVRLSCMFFIVSHDSFILLTWLIYEIFVSWLYRVWGSGRVLLGMVAGIYHSLCYTTHSYLWRDLFICVAWLFRVLRSGRVSISMVAVIYHSLWYMTHSLCYMIHTCDVTYLLNMCAMTAQGVEVGECVY